MLGRSFRRSLFNERNGTEIMNPIIDLEETFSIAAKQLNKSGLSEAELIGLLRLALDEVPNEKPENFGQVNS